MAVDPFETLWVFSTTLAVVLAGLCVVMAVLYVLFSIRKLWRRARRMSRGRLRLPVLSLTVLAALATTTLAIGERGHLLAKAAITSD